jgi:hypothetical protein
LTSHNQTHNNPLEPIKKLLYYYGFVSHNVTSENNYGNFVGWFFLDWCHNWRHHFFMGLLITFYIQWQRQHLVWGHCWRKNESFVAPGS